MFRPHTTGTFLNMPPISLHLKSRANTCNLNGDFYFMYSPTGTIEYFFFQIPISNSCEQTKPQTEYLPHARTPTRPDLSLRVRRRVTTSHTTLFRFYSDMSSTIESCNIHYSPILFSLLRNFITFIIFSPLFHAKFITRRGHETWCYQHYHYREEEW